MGTRVTLSTTFFSFCVQTVYPCSPSLFYVPESPYHVAFFRRGFMVSPSPFYLLHKIVLGSPAIPAQAERRHTVRWESLDRESRHTPVMATDAPTTMLLCVNHAHRVCSHQEEADNTLGIFRTLLAVPLHALQLLQHCTKLVKPWLPFSCIESRTGSTTCYLPDFHCL